MNSRKPVHAGRFYPSDKKELSLILDSFKDRWTGKNIKSPALFGISPHAGIVYSGMTAFHFYVQAKNLDAERAVIIGPSHHHLFSGFALSDAFSWETPLGDLQTDMHFSKSLVSKDVFFDNSIHSREHSLEVQTVFIKHFLPELKIVPVVMGRQSPNAVSDFISLIDSAKAKKTLFIASSDLYHGYDYDEAKRTDMVTIKEILKEDESGFMKYFQITEEEGLCAACGGGPIAIIMGLAKEAKASLTLLNHTTSSDVTQDYDGYTVGYSSFIGVKS